MKSGCKLPFNVKNALTRIPFVKNRYANLLRNKFLHDALHSILEKQAIKTVKVQSSLAFYNHLFLVLKIQQVAPNLRHQISKHVPEGPDLQSGNSRVYTAVTANRKVGLISRFQ